MEHLLCVHAAPAVSLVPITSLQEGITAPRSPPFKTIALRLRNLPKVEYICKAHRAREATTQDFTPNLLGL
jgi:hypothetical protein